MNNEGLMHMPHNLLKQFTDGFSGERMLSRGIFGDVYKGDCKDGKQIAVKLLKSMRVDENEFRREFMNLRKLKHQNIVSLVGFCDEAEEISVEFEGKQIIALWMHTALCFEYMHDRSLHKHLSDEYHAFDWQERYKIIKGICEGLKYLYMGERPIFHLDLNPDNILLDMNMVPKIAYFGLSRLLGDKNTQKAIMDAGAREYIPPEYTENQIISKEFDIFSLGVIIIKIITGLTGYSLIGDMEPARFVEHVSNRWRERLQEKQEYTLHETHDQQLRKCIEIALQCIDKEKTRRPTIVDIVDQLNVTEKHQHDLVPLTEKFDNLCIPSDSNIPARRSPEVANRGKIAENKGLFDMIPEGLPLEYFMEITKNFSDERKLSEGAFGTLYKGILPDGQVVAVKKLAENTAVPVGDQFLKEATNLKVIQHKNILKLIYYCSEVKKNMVVHNGKYIPVNKDEYVLCYEYALKGSLRNNLRGDSNTTDWDTNFQIIKGICHGLHFLHEGMGARIVHLDLQPDNILLDDDMVPKIADSGLSRFFSPQKSQISTTSVVGAVGYMAPEYFRSGEISTKCDIYSLGIIILEITTREKNYPNHNDRSARKFIQNVRQTWTNEHIASKYSSIDSDRLRQVKICINIGLECVDVDQEKRPSIVHVVGRLDGRIAS